jgi:hypothetical protein
MLVATYGALPYVEVLAIDLRALMENQRVSLYPRLPWSEDLATRADFALRFMGLPWMVVVGGGLLLRLRARWVPGSWHLGAGPVWMKGLLVAATLPPFLVFGLPLAVGMSVWTIVETYPWIRGEVMSVVEPLFWIGLTVFSTGAALLGVVGLRLALRARVKPPSRPAWQRWTWRVVLLLVVCPVALANLGLGALALAHGARLWPVLGSVGLFAERCGSCHVDGAPLFYVEAPDDWRRRFERFNLAEKAGLSPGEAEQVLGFVVGMRSFSDETAFRSRCQRCHVASYLAWDDRHPEDWDLLTARLARHAPHYYSESVRAQITSYLSREASRGDEGPGLSGEAYRSARTAIRVCTGCHFLARRAEAYRDIQPRQAEELVRRMSAYKSRPLGDEDVARIADAYRTLVSNPDLLGRLVPHDGPPHREVLRW